MALHGALPVPARIPVGKLRLGADRRGIKQHLRPAEDKTTRGLGEPLVPADTESDFAELGVPHAESGVAGIEVILFLVAHAIRDVRLAVETEHLPAGVDHGDRVEIGLVVALEEAEGQHDVQFAGQRLECGDAFVAFDRTRQLEISRQLVLAKVGRLEKLLDKDDARALRGGLADQLFRAIEALHAVLAAGHLRGRHSNVAHGGQIRRFLFCAGAR